VTLVKGSRHTYEGVTSHIMKKSLHTCERVTSQIRKEFCHTWQRKLLQDIYVFAAQEASIAALRSPALERYTHTRTLSFSLFLFNCVRRTRSLDRRAPRYVLSLLPPPPPLSLFVSLSLSLSLSLFISRSLSHILYLDGGERRTVGKFPNVANTHFLYLHFFSESIIATQFLSMHTRIHPSIHLSITPSPPIPFFSCRGGSSSRRHPARTMSKSHAHTHTHAYTHIGSFIRSSIHPHDPPFAEEARVRADIRQGPRRTLMGIPSHLWLG